MKKKHGCNKELDLGTFVPFLSCVNEMWNDDSVRLLGGYKSLSWNFDMPNFIILVTTAPS